MTRYALVAWFVIGQLYLAVIRMYLFVVKMWYHIRIAFLTTSTYIILAMCVYEVLKVALGLHAIDNVN